MRPFTQNARCDESILRDALRSSSSGTSRSVQGIPSAVRAITSASSSSVLAVAGNISRACFSALPGR